MKGKMILIVIVCLAGIVLLSVMAAVLISRFIKKRQKKKEDGKDLLYRRVSAAREIVAPDGIDPNPLPHLVFPVPYDRRTSEEDGICGHISGVIQLQTDGRQHIY